MKNIAHVLFTIASLIAGATHAATFTVGPNGSLPTIQAGINAALLAGGSNEVHVQTGLYNENLTLTQSSGMLDVSGSWNSTFTQQSLDPAATFINGGGMANVLAASVTGGELSFSTVSFVGGLASNLGGGAYVLIDNSGLVQIRNSHFSLNSVQASGTADAQGGGIFVELSNTSGLIFDGNLVASNSAIVSSGNSYGGGMVIAATDSSNASIANSVIQNNTSTATSTGFAPVGGAYFKIAGGAQISVARSSFLTNSVSKDGYSGAFVGARCAGPCQFSLDQSTFDGNHGFGATQRVGVTQLGINLQPTGSPTARIADTRVSRGDGIGLYLPVFGGTANVTNLTVADNAGSGMYFGNGPTSTITLYNTIAFGNAPDLDTNSSIPTQKGNNLIGVDPQFVDAAHGNYHLMSTSPARDAGTLSPPGGLGLFDLDGNPRVFGPAPDIGAYEIGDEIFKNGFE